MSYPLARGKMLKVWAKVECPVCDGELSHVGDEVDEDEHIDCYSCDYCGILVSYVSPASIHEYHLVPDSDKRYIIESS